MGEIITAGHRNHEEINEILTKHAWKMWAAEARIAGAEAMMDAMVMETPVKPGPKSKYQHHAYGCYTDSSGTVHTGTIPGEGPHVEYWRGTWLAAESLPLLTEEELQAMWDDAHVDSLGRFVIGPPPPEGWWGDSEAWQADPVPINPTIMPYEYTYASSHHNAPESLPLLTDEEIQTMWDDDAFASGRVHPDPVDYEQRYIEVDW